MSENEIRLNDSVPPGDGRNRLNLRSLLQEMIDRETLTWSGSNR